MHHRLQLQVEQSAYLHLLLLHRPSPVLFGLVYKIPFSAVNVNQCEMNHTGHSGEINHTGSLYVLLL
jgi:hypothetical protein